MNAISEPWVQCMVPIRNPLQPFNTSASFELHNCVITAALFNQFKVLMLEYLLH